MAIKQLSDEQIATWTREQKDTWWYENVYRGDMPQLTIRAAITGFLLGGVLSAIDGVKPDNLQLISCLRRSFLNRQPPTF